MITQKFFFFFLRILIYYRLGVARFIFPYYKTYLTPVAGPLVLGRIQECITTIDSNYFILSFLCLIESDLLYLFDLFVTGRFPFFKKKKKKDSNKKLLLQL